VKDYTSFNICRTKEGKPYLDSNSLKTDIFPNFNFNVSHHADWVIISSEPECIVGSDVMKIEITGVDQNMEHFFRDLEGCFTKYEWAIIRGSTEPLEYFYRYWTLKESYIKAVGIGLGMELQRLEYHLNVSNFTRSINMGEYNTSLYIDAKIATAWKFEQYFLDNEHIAAVALGPPNEAIESYKKSIKLRYKY